jgi:hypothetical protein
VHPGEQQDEQGNDDDDEDKDFRVDYVFDAYLLGFCDDVARILAKQLFSSEHDSSHKAYKDGKLLAALDEEDDHYDMDDWRSCKVPKERLFLFPGAQPPSNDDESVLTYREVAQCDGCSVRIDGTIHKCVECFDYDLCAACYPTLYRTHGDGKHQFVEEVACLEADSQQENKSRVLA